MDNEKLYIPYGLSTEQTYFTGFGKTELRQFIIGVIIFAAIGALLLIATSEVATMVVTLIIGIAGSIMMTRKDPNTRISVVGQVYLLVRFARTQKHYKYVYKSIWAQN